MVMLQRICPECESFFERESWDINKYERGGKIVYCSRSCASKVSNRNRYAKRLLVCAGCKQEVIVNASSQKDKYCSKPCYFEHQKDIIAERARKIGKESAQKISETRKKNLASGKVIHPWVGRAHSKKTKEKISKSRKKYYETHDGYWKNKKLPESAKVKMSETRTKKWVNGDYDHIKMAWAKGHYFFKKSDREVYYRSSWELAFMKHLDAKEEVVRCEYERIRIPYRDTESRQRHYVPDILVEYIDDRKVLYEIKPFVRKDSEINKRKFKAARQYCKENNLKFKVVTEKYLKHIGAM